jgi:hypothetical protein
MVIAIVPAVELVAYHVSVQWSLSPEMRALCVHEEVLGEVTPVMDLSPPFPTHDRYNTSFGWVVVKVIVIVFPLVTDVDAEPSNPKSTKFAVTDPAPLICAVVEAAFASSNVMEPVAVHCENPCVPSAAAEIATEAPAS